MCEVMGIERTVQVSASVYGFDNSLTLDVIRRLGQHRARGVAGVSARRRVPPSSRGCTRGGFRGARLSTHIKGYGGSEVIAALGTAAFVRSAGTCSCMSITSASWRNSRTSWLRTEVAMVFDHLGCARGEDTVADHPGFEALLRILQQRDDWWVKVSSWYRRIAGRPARTTPTCSPLSQALVAARPDRVVWGTQLAALGAVRSRPAVPEDERLIDLFCEWVPEARTREQILVANPARLYGFAD